MLNQFDCEDLLCHILWIDINGDYEDEMEQKLYDEYGMEITQFVDLMEKLLPMVDKNTTIGMEEPTEYKWFSVSLWWGLKKFLLKMKI